MKSSLIFLLSLFCLSIIGQQNNTKYVIDFITTKQGLSHNYASSIVSDDLNTKWIGTENGISKFNGLDFEYIKPNANFKGLLNENIEILFADKTSNIWIGTKSGGLSHLNIKSNQITNYNYLIDLEGEGDLRITSLAQDKNNHIWVGTWKNGIYVIDIKNDRVVKHYPYHNIIHKIVLDHFDNIWFSKGYGVYKFSSDYDHLEEYIIKNPITELLPDPSRNKLWIGTSGNDSKLYGIDFDTKIISTIETNVTSTYTKQLSLDHYNRIWIGTWRNGIYISDENLTSFNKINLISRNSKKTNNNYNTILDIHHDGNKVTWLATANGGIVKLHESNGFDNADLYISDNSLSNNLNCNAIYQEGKLLFVGTFAGLYVGENFSTLSKLKQIGDVKINALYEHDAKLFIGTAKGFHIYDFKLKKIIFSTNNLAKITSFLVDDGLLFIGTQQLGIASVRLTEIDNFEVYNLFSENESAEFKIESNRITSLKKDNNDNIWVGTYNGLHLYNREGKVFIHQSQLLNEKLPTVIINSIAIEGNHIWLATPNGLIKLNYNGIKLQVDKTVTKEDGLNSDFICSVTFDRYSNLWLSTHTEIVKYTDQSNSIISYGDINGIRSTSFNNNSFYINKEQDIYFGGVDNVTFFNPENIKDLSVTPKVIYTKLRVNNKIISFKPGSTIIDKNFDYVEAIVLNHKEKFFSLSFVANDFLGNLNIKYRYLLEGYQDKWIDLQNRNEINFAGLSSGEYTLKVIASRDNQNWSNPQKLKITLKSSPWISPLAILLYGLIGAVTVFYLIQSKNYKLKLQNNLEIAKIDREKELELTEAKLNFFTNISHEFRTPLTLIIGPLKELLQNQKLPQNAFKNLSYIDKHTNRLLNLINQLLDFRKADHGLLKLNVSEGNFVRFSNEVFLYFTESAKSKNIKYSFESSNEAIEFPFDRNKMEIVLCNVLSNAIKYSSENDSIEMAVESNMDHCIITIKDSGIGMNAEETNRIFDRFYQIKSADTASLVGSGIGLAFSKKIIELHHGSIEVASALNVGSTFTIKLSLDRSLYGSAINNKFIKTDNIKAYNIDRISDPNGPLKLKPKSHSILIIDDNPDILDFLNDILMDEYNVLQAKNGVEGLKKASEHIPDLIISDVMMPEKDGISLCKDLKSQITTSHIPVILLTARTSTVYEIEGLKTGANDYITKPFDGNIVKARIESLLANREKLRLHLVNKVRFEPTISNPEVELKTDPESEFINKAIILVEKNLNNPEFGIDSMVTELYMSQSTLYRKIKSLTGLSLTAFIRSVRLKKAAVLISTTNLNLKQISFEVGFNDYKYFKNSFKKQFDCLPSQYKNLVTP